MLSLAIVDFSKTTPDFIFKDSVVVNDRWGSDTLCKHGGYFTCHDRYNPGVLQKQKFENAMTLNKNSWSWRRDTNIGQFLTTKEMLQVR